MPKNNYRLNFFYQLYSNKVMIFISMIEFIVLSCLCVDIAQSNNYFENFIQILNAPFIIGLGILPILFYESGRINFMFENLNSLSFRFGNKKTYIRELIINILINNTFIYIIFLMFVTIFLNFFRGGNFTIELMADYSILNIIYLLFVLLKSYVFINVIVVITTLLIKLTNVICSIVIQISISTGIFLLCPYPRNVAHINDISLNPLHIIGDTLIFERFGYYLLYVFTYFLLFCLLAYFLYKKCIKKDIKVIN